MVQNIHATAIKIKSKTILLIGDSGSGKSDIALRLIAEHNAKLISDDRVDVANIKGRLRATAPKTIKNLIEVRGVGIIKVSCCTKGFVDMVVKMTSAPLIRMPSPSSICISGVDLPLLELNPFEASATAKLLAALRLL